MSLSAERIAALSPKQREIFERLLREKGLELSQFQIPPRGDRSQLLPLSFAQQRLWFLDQLEPGSPAYNLPSHVRIRGALDVAVLIRTLGEIVCRHEVLRTVFQATEGQAVQKIRRRQRVAVPVVDLSALPAELCEAECRARILADAGQPFDLTVGPLLRSSLLRLSPNHHILLATMHHIVSDAWSMRILVREFVALYRAFAVGEAPNLPKLPIQYADYAIWQRQWLQGERFEQQLAWWRKNLAGASANLELSTDRPRTGVRDGAGAMESVRLGPGITAGLKTLGREQESTLFMVLLAAFGVLLHRYSGQAEILIGSPIANRNRGEVEHLIGFFINTLVLRLDFSGNPGFRDFLARVREQTLGAHSHQDLPFEKVVEELRPERSTSHMPLFRVWFTLQNVPQDSISLPGLEVSRIDVHNRTAKFDLTFTVTEVEGALAGSLEYRCELFHRQTIEKMLAHFEILLEGILEDPGQDLSSLPMLREAEVREILVERNATAAEFPGERPIHELFAEGVRRHRARTALVFGDEEMDYGELDERANQLARHLLALGMKARDRVGIHIEHSPYAVIALLAVLKGGAAYVPIDPGHPIEQSSFIVRDAELSVILTERKLAGRLAVEGLVEVCLDLRPEKGEEGTCPEVEVGPEDIAYVIYTSGSTGWPKGVQIPHRALVNYVWWARAMYAREDHLRFALYSSLAFDLTVTSIYPPLLGGHQILIYRDEEEPAIVEVLADNRVDVLKLTPSHLRLLLNHDLSACGVRRLIVGGEALLTALAEELEHRLPGPLEIFNEYGPTEATVGCMIHRYDAERDERAAVPIGLPAANTEIYCLDEQGRPVAELVTGEIYIGGEGLARGYLNRDELTAACFVEHPFAPDRRVYRTGDLARWLLSGALEFVGRRDEQVKFHGYRVELNGIRALLNEHPNVRDSVVLLRQAADRREMLVAYYVSRRALEVAELRAFLAQRMIEETIPNLFVHLRRLPLTLNGKVNIAGLPSIDEVLGERKKEAVAPRTPTEALLAEIWSELLRVPSVGVFDNYFEMGGDSILSIQIISRATREGLCLAPKQMFDHPTIAELAAVADAAREVSPERMEAGPVVGEMPLTPIQRWFFEQDLEHPEHFNQAVLLEFTEAVPRAVRARRLRRALGHLLVHHDALRLRFEQTARRWRQENAAPAEEPGVLTHLDLATVPEAAREKVVGRVAARLQQGFDLGRNPLLRVLYITECDRPDRLMMIAHHLVVDGVSWRHLLEDLEILCRQLAAGEELDLAPRTTSYKRWAEASIEYAASPRLAAEGSFWRTLLASPLPEVPVDFEDGENTVASAQRVRVTLSSEETRALLEDVPEVYRTHINDVLLSALVEAFAPWTGKRRLWLELEGHGREEFAEDLDVSRTVGWFTAIYPVVLDLTRIAEDRPGDALKAVKEQLRAIPSRGVGYGVLRYLAEGEVGEALRSIPRAQVAFNYLGQLDQSVGADRLFRPTSGELGAVHHPGQLRPYLVEINGAVSEGQLRMTITGSAHRHRLKTLEALADRYLVALRDLIAHCRSPEAGGRTPSDFPLVELDQGSLDNLLASADGEVEDLYPATPMQRGMLFHTLHSPAAGIYVVQLSFDLAGPLDEEVFRETWLDLADRHPVLRTAFAGLELARPLQVVLERPEQPWAREDWRRRGAEEESARLAAFLERDRLRGFDVSRAPLMRFALMELGPQRYRFVWSFHHLLLDGWSMSILMKEFFILYDASRRDTVAHIEAQGSYRGFVAWLEEQDVSAARGFWQRELAGMSAPTALGVDVLADPRTAPADSDTRLYSEAIRELRVAPPGAARAFAQAHQLTVNTLLQGAWAVLLNRYSGEEDVVFGAVTSGRAAPLPGIESVVGLFINTLPVRTRVDPALHTVPWLDALQAHQSELRQYEYSPLFQVQGWSEVGRGQSLFETILAFESYPIERSVEEREASELEVTGARAVEYNSYPIAVVVAPGDVLGVKVVYDARRFDRVVVLRMLSHLDHLLAALLDEDRTLSGLSPLSPAERHQLILETNDSLRARPAVDFLPDLLAEALKRHREAEAVVFGNVVLCYDELEARSHRLAHHLLDLGVGAGARVGLLLEHAPETLVAVLAVLSTGAAYVPLDPSHPRGRTEMIAEDAGIGVLLTQKALADTLSVDGLRVICLDAAEDPAAGRPTTRPTVEPSADALAYVLYTSGSTGRPKGVKISHRALINYVVWARSVYVGDETVSFALYSSLAFDLTVTSIFPPLLSGNRIVVYRDRRDDPAVVRIVTSGEVDVLKLTPSHLALIRELDLRDSRVRRLIVGGEALPTKLAREIHGAFGGAVEILNEYGPTEATVGCMLHRFDPERDVRATVPIGFPAANTEIHVLDSTLHPVVENGVGELYIAGVGLAQGYLNLEELTAERFIDHPFRDGARLYRSGDLARRLPGGGLEFLGRRDEQVKFHGHRLELEGIKSSLVQHPKIRDGVVTLRQDERGRDVLVAYYVGRQALDHAELRDFLGQWMIEDTIPNLFVHLRRLPLTLNGKVNYAALPSVGEARGQLERQFEAPASASEKVLADIWAAVLGLDRVGVEENFFQLGGDSILSIQVISRANRAGLRLATRQLFEHPTVRALAAAADRLAAAEHRSLEHQAPTPGEVPLTPVQHWFFEQRLAHPEHYHQALVLEVASEAGEADHLERAVEYVLEHHDALRLRFTPAESGAAPWRQVQAGSDEGRSGRVFTRLDVSALPADRRGAAVERVAKQLQGGISLEGVPLLRGMHCTGFEAVGDEESGRDRLVLMIHHLAVDGVSWRILLEDLEILCRQLSGGEEPTLPARTTSFKHWAQRLVEHAASAQILAQESYYAESLGPSLPAVPRDVERGENTFASARSVRVELSPEETRELLQEVPAAYRTRIDEVLLGALAEALAGWLGDRRVGVALEGHGRKEFADDLDVSRTVGWFTSIYPAVLDLRHVAAEDPGALLKTVKEQLRAIPDRGLGFGLLRYLSIGEVAQRVRELPSPEVSFNYLGQLDSAVAEGGLFRAAAESAGAERHPAQLRSHLVDVSGAVHRGRLWMQLVYSENRHRQATIEALAESFLGHLRGLIAHCRSPEAGGYTPSDFPLAQVDQAALDRLVAAGEPEDVYASSPMQQGMVFHSLQTAGSGAYVVQLAFSLGGRLHLAAFEEAWTRMLERHAVLRTGFFWQGVVEPLQVVHPRVELPLGVADWSTLGEAEREERFAAFLQDDRRRGFDLTAPPLLRLKLFQLDAERFRLVWTFHHVLLDGWSMPILLREFFTFYEAIRRGETASLPAPRPYRDYIAWLLDQDPVAAEEFWRRELTGFTTATPLVVERPSAPSSAVEDADHDQVVHRYPGAVTTRLEAFAKGRQLTLNTLFQGAWALLLSRYSGREDVIFGTVTSGRSVPLEGVGEILGLFINTLPARVRTAPEARPAEWLPELQSRQAEARQYEYSSLVRIHGWSDLPRGRLLFESILAFENFPVDESVRERAGASLGVGRAETWEQPDYPLVVAVMPGAELEVKILYDARRFEATTVERMERHLAILVEGLLEAERPLADLDLLPASQRHQLLVEWNDTAAEPVADSIVSLVAARVLEAPHATAAVYEDQHLSYGELYRRARGLAATLAGLGSGPEARVGVCLERSPDWLVGLLGVLRVGAAYVAMDPRHPSERLAFLLRDSGAGILVTESGSAADAAAFSGTVLYLGGGLGPAGTESGAAVPSAPWILPENLAYVIYTSGSTGQPKGVQVSHRGLLNLVSWHHRAHGIGAEDRTTQLASQAFDASVWEVWAALSAGAALHLVSPATRASAEGIASWLVSRRITSTFLPTPLAEQMMGLDWPAASTLRTVLTGGDTLRRRPSPELPFTLVNHYGPTECSVVSTAVLVPPLAPGAAQGGSSPPIGQPIDNGRALVLDHRLRPVAPGVVGELCMAGPSLARGYLGRPATTVGVFVPDSSGRQAGARLYRSGDLVRARADGALEFLGRRDHQVKVRGHRIELGEIEATLLAHAGVRGAVMLAREDVPGDQRLVAYLVLEAEGAPHVDDLRYWLRERLPEYLVPSHFVELGEFPLTDRDKVDRAALPAPGSSADGADAPVAPATGLEQRITEVWRRVLRVEEVEPNDNFFDLGGHSLLLIQVQRELAEALDHGVEMVDLFTYSTVRTLARYLESEVTEPAPERRDDPAATHGADIAIIGLSGRFPGAADSESFWRNLRDGVESISFFSEEELRAAGTPPELLANPRFVPARGVLFGIAEFDAEFFGLSPREAEVTDPQHRLFLECAWQALEVAGYDPEGYAGRIGVFGGTSANSYWRNLATNPEVAARDDPYQVLISNDKDFLPTRVSYKLNLTGPSLAVQTACSTSLVAVHLACQSLRHGEADMALAGGVSIGGKEASGYVYQPGGINSPDGHCRAFDARAAGTLSGDGVGVVVLKRLADALADGDTIRAVIKGSAINNDGSRKVGYTAPSVAGQGVAIRDALALGGVDPATVGYVEAHGTGTELGDPIEIEALTTAFREAGAAEKSFCALGSVKTNIGHLDAAAGVAGLIKTVLALEHGFIPPSLHFEAPNPHIDFDGSPFYVAATGRPWPRGATPRRAGVSSFGIGGTNAHLVLEEAPEPAAAAASRRWQVLPLSARSEAALQAAGDRLVKHLQTYPEACLADVAHTLQVGRRAFSWRRTVVCRQVEEAVTALQSPAAAVAPRALPVAFLFPGQGAQRVSMGCEMYEMEQGFRRVIDECSELLRPELGFDLACRLFAPEPGEEAWTEDDLKATEVAQPALFVVEYALARLWMSWGIEPRAMIGHSLGEYVAACVAGVLTLPEALRLVAFRGRWMQALPTGSMLGVALEEEDLVARLREPLSLAAVNGVGRCVVSGPDEAVAAFAARLSEEGVSHRPVETSHAFHSGMMEPMMDAFRKALKQVRWQRPRIPYVSNLTGEWIRPSEAMDPDYWLRHLRQPVRFDAGLGKLLKEGEQVLLEVGPGRTLSDLARRHPGADDGVVALSSLPPRRGDDSEVAELLGTLGRAWTAGVAVKWAAVRGAEARRRVPLPTYPFERRTYWVEGGALPLGSSAVPVENPDVADWFYLPDWRPTAPNPARVLEPSTQWLLLVDGLGVGQAVAERLRSAEQRVTTVASGERFRRVGELEFVLDPRRPEDYGALFAALVEEAGPPMEVVHLWSLTGEEGSKSPAKGLEELGDRGVSSLLFLVRALTAHHPEEARISVVSNGLHTLHDGEEPRPEKAPLLGPLGVLSQEFPEIRCRSIDITATGGLGVDGLYDELVGEHLDPRVALRRRGRFVLAHQPVRLEAVQGIPSLLRRGGVYLILGGLGGIGLHLAEYLARTVDARLVLVGRTALESENRRVQALEEAGSEILVAAADVADRRQMRALMARIGERFGALNGVFHAAGATGEAAFLTLQETGPAEVETQFRAKVWGTLTLAETLEGVALDFCMLFSSLSTVLGGLGLGAYAAANHFLDAYARWRGRGGEVPWLSVAWDGWRLVDGTRTGDLGIDPEKGMDALGRALRLAPSGQVVVSTGDLEKRTARWQRPAGPEPGEEACRSTTSYSRPRLYLPFEEPEGDVERTIACHWQELLGVEPIGRLDDFYELGGDSLLATRLMSMLRKSFRVDLPLRAVFDAPTLAALAEVVGAARSRPEDGGDTDLAGDAIPRRSGAGNTFPPSFAQQRLWFVCQLDPRSTAYNLAAFTRLEGPLETAALEKSLEQILERHEVLRTVYWEGDQGLVQVVLEAGAWYLPLVDLERQAPEVREEAVRLLISHELNEPFALDEGPLWRCTLVRLGPEEHVLLLSIHHIASDGWSMRLLLREVKALYEANVSGTPFPLPELPVQYADFAVWQRRYLSGERFEALAAYWKEQLDGAPRTFTVPPDRPRPEIARFRGRTQGMHLGVEFVERLERLGRVEGATLFMTLWAAFTLLLHRVTGERDIVAGTDIANRNREEIEPLIGFFVNQLVLRVELSGDPTFREHLRQVRDMVLSAYAHQDMPFDKLVESLATERTSNRQPLLQVKLVLQNFPPLPRSFEGGLRMQPVPLELETSKMDLLFDLIHSPEGLAVSLQYDADLYESTTIKRLLAGFESALGLAAADPEATLDALGAAMDSAEQERSLAEKRRLESDRSKVFKRAKRMRLAAGGKKES